jgi:hypothetical protein
MKQEFLEEFADFCSGLAQDVIMLLARRQIHTKNTHQTVFLLCNCLYNFVQPSTAHVFVVHMLQE